MNIVLIGMPGCGKSTLGAIVAKKMGRTFLDVDTLITSREGCTISTLFANRGEAYFRWVETLVTCEAAKVEQAVISTGGGVVLRSENMAALSATGTVFFIDRPPEDIAGEEHSGRPLLMGGRTRVFDVYTQRIDLYRNYAQYVVKSGSSVTETLRRLLETIEGAGI